METSMNLLDKFNRWLSESIMVKLGSIGFLILILLIPSAWIESLISEREGRADSVVDEIASKWSGPQTIRGPVLSIPFIVYYEAEVQNERGVGGKTIIETKKEMRQRVENAYFLPENLNIVGTVKPQVLSRGIFDAAVYESGNNLTATFSKPDFAKLKVKAEEIIWDEAELIVGITDLRGISDNPALVIGGTEYTGEPTNNLPFGAPGYDNQPPSGTGVVVRLPWKSAEDFRGDVSMKLPLKGSSSMYFTPVGKTTSVQLSGPWASPSFDGEFLPASRTVTEENFSASWKILHYNRPFTQSWIGSGKDLSGYDFGAKLLIPVDQYQKSMRTSKYGVLVIVLTFVSLFMVEIMKKIRIHPFQYILIGAALIIYYSLLLSFSEQVGYNWAYLISTVSTVILIGLYSTTFLNNRVLVITFTSLLTFFYGFIFVIIQMQDFSLLLGSVGLFLIIGAIMYFSRSIKWYKEAIA